MLYKIAVVWSLGCDSATCSPGRDTGLLCYVVDQAEPFFTKNLWLRKSSGPPVWPSKPATRGARVGLHTLGILSTSFTWHRFPTVLKEFPHMLRTCWLLFLHSAVQLIPNHLNWVEVRWLWRPSHLMHHSITLLLGKKKKHLHSLEVCLGHCPVEKQMIVPLSANQMGWPISAECCGSHAG